jgi:hypothetical protein
MEQRIPLHQSMIGRQRMKQLTLHVRRGIAVPSTLLASLGDQSHCAPQTSAGFVDPVFETRRRRRIREAFGVRVACHRCFAKLPEVRRVLGRFRDRPCDRI